MWSSSGTSFAIVRVLGDNWDRWKPKNQAEGSHFDRSQFVPVSSWKLLLQVAHGSR
jgi:hypothetical protein